MKPYRHAENSTKKYGGVPDDYFPIHNFMDSSKAHIADVRHRAILHSSFGCFIVEEVFGVRATNSEGGTYSPRDVAEDHVMEDLGRIPSVQDWLGPLPLAKWMGGGGNGKPMGVLERLKQAESAAGEAFVELVKEEAKRIFDATPVYDRITWSQYTPYFNDGDVCEFRVHGVYGQRRGEPTGVGDYLDAPFFTAYPALFLDAFGDHVQVTVDRNLEVTKDRCDHD